MKTGYTIGMQGVGRTGICVALIAGLGVTTQPEWFHRNAAAQTAAVSVDLTLRVPEAATIESLTILGQNSVTLEDRSRVLDDTGSGYGRLGLTSQATLTLGVGAHAGELISKGNVFLRDDAVVHGNVTAGGVFQKQSIWTVQGDVFEHAAVPMRDVTYASASFSGPLTDGLSLEPDQTQTTPLPPGRYRRIVLKRNSQATLVSGNYIFEEFNVDDASRLKIDNTNGPVYVYVSQTATVKGAVTQTQGGFPDWVLGYVGAGSVFINKPFRGTVVAPNGSINLEGQVGTIHEGAFLGSSVRVAPDCVVKHHQRSRFAINVTMDDSTVCHGDSVHITASATDPSSPAQPPIIYIDGLPASDIWGQYDGGTGRRITVAAQAADGAVETKTVTVGLETCARAPATIPPVLVGRPNLYRQDEVMFFVRNAVEVLTGSETFHWDFGDGTTISTQEPALSHSFTNALPNNKIDNIFHVALTVSRPGELDVTVRKTFSITNSYALTKSQRGSIETPVAIDQQTLTDSGADWTGSVSLSNREPEKITFFRQQVMAMSCGTDQLSGSTTSSSISFELNGNDKADYTLAVPKSSLIGSCAADVHLFGRTASNLPVEAHFMLGRPPDPGLQGELLSDAENNILNFMVANGLVGDPNLVTEEEVTLAYLKRQLHVSLLEAPASTLLQLSAAPGELCDPNNPGQPPTPGYTCQPTGEWQTELESWEDPDLGPVAPQAHLANAFKGDIVLIRGCSPPLAALTQTLDQRFTHVGTMTKNLFEMRHSFGDSNWLVKTQSNGIADATPTDGFLEQGLRFLWPGTVTATVEQAFLSGKDVTDPQGGVRNVKGFYKTEAYCPGDTKVTFPHVVKPPPEYETLVRPLLAPAIDAAKDINGHYRFAIYSHAESEAEDPNGPAPVLGPDGLPETYGKVPTVCSSFSRLAALGAGVTVNADRARPIREEVNGMTTPDGLIVYPEGIRKNAAETLYNDFYNKVDREVETIEAAYDEYFWAGETALIAFGGPVGWVAGGAILGATAFDELVVVKWATDARDDVGNQVTNCFASDFCSEDAKDSDRWKSPGIGVAVSPDDLLDHYDRPEVDQNGALLSGLYGYSERLIFRGKRFRPVARWQPSSSMRTIVGTTVEAGQGVPISEAVVYVVGAPGQTATSDANGSFQIDAVPNGNIQLHGQKMIGGRLYEGDACYAPDLDEPDYLRRVACTDFGAPLDEVLYSEVLVELIGPDPRFRRVTIETTAVVTDCDCGGGNDSRLFPLQVSCTVSELEPASGFTAPELCVDEVGGKISGTCTLVEGSEDVAVHIDFKIYEGGGGSCGANELQVAESMDFIARPGTDTLQSIYVSDEDLCWYGPIPNSCPNSIQVYANSGTVTNDVAD